MVAGKPESGLSAHVHHYMSKQTTMSALPLLPKTVHDTGLGHAFVAELVAKAVFVFGKTHLPVLAAKLALSVNVLNEVLRVMVAEHLVEITRRGATDIDVEYQLTDAGKKRAAEYMTRCRYVGPAPVTLAAYRSMVEQQSTRADCVTQKQVEAEFSDFSLNPGVRDQVGAAMNSGRPLFLYGPAGSGKTYLAEKLGRLMRGAVAIPYAILVENEVIQVFDPLLHEATAVEPGATEAVALDHFSHDGRWLLCQRPVVHTGGELTLDMLELRYDHNTGLYQSPPHFKANNGIFIVDDLGRQQVSPRDLMNRWIVPLDRGQDHLSLHTGYKFTVPFNVTVVFSTNQHPESLADESFMRRLGYKIHVGPLTEDEYHAVFRQYAQALSAGYNEESFRYLVDKLHRHSGRALLACYPRDLLGQVADYAKYFGEEPVLSPHALERAWRTYFAQHDEVPDD